MVFLKLAVSYPLFFNFTKFGEAEIEESIRYVHNALFTFLTLTFVKYDTVSELYPTLF